MQAALEVRALPVDFCLLLFDIDRTLKRYAGGLVHSMDQLLYIEPLGFRPDDEVTASLFGGFRFLMKPEARQTETVPS